MAALAGLLALATPGLAYGAPASNSVSSSARSTIAAIAANKTGDVFYALLGSHTIKEQTPTGRTTVVAGDGHSGRPVPGPATSSPLGAPDALAVDSAGNLYIADAGNNVIEKVTPSGQLSIVAGNGHSGRPVPGPATSSPLGAPDALAVDRSGNLYVASWTMASIAVITPAGRLSIVAGNGHSGRPVPGPATSSPLGQVQGVAVDRSGNLYIADAGNNVIEEVAPSGRLSIAVGIGGASHQNLYGATIQTPYNPNVWPLDRPSAVAVDSSGNLYIADAGNNMVEKLDTSDQLWVVAGNGGYGSPISGPAIASPLPAPSMLAVGRAGTLYVASAWPPVILQITKSGMQAPVAGWSWSPGSHPCRISCTTTVTTPVVPTPLPAKTRPKLDGLWTTAVAVSSSGDLYVAFNNERVEKITPAGRTTIVAGNGHYGTPVPGPATSSPLAYPIGIAVDSAGNLYIADDFFHVHVVEKVTRSGQLSIVAGNGHWGRPVPGPATSSPLDGPTGVAVDSSGNLYIADGGNNVIEKVTPSGQLSIVAGNGHSGRPVPGPATSSPLGGPVGVAVDSAGNLYIAANGSGSGSGNVVVKVTPSGQLSIVAGSGTWGTPVSGPATSSPLTVSRLAVDSSGNLYVADGWDNKIAKVTPAGQLSLYAGTDLFNPDLLFGEPYSGPLEWLPDALAVDSAGNLYVTYNFPPALVKVTPAGQLSEVAGPPLWRWVCEPTSNPSNCPPLPA